MLNTKNTVYLVGELVEVKDFKEGNYDDKNYVATTIVIKSIVDGVELLTEARSFTNELKKDGTPNKNYSTMKNISTLLNKRVVVSGAQLRGERFWSPRTNQLTNAVRINFNIIRTASPKDEDKATFDFGGFVTRPLQEVVDENNNVKHYQITLGQANYSETNMFEVAFTVDASNVAAARAIENMYTAGTTVEVSGNYRTIVTTVEKVTEVAFGDPVVKKYNNVNRKLVITSGSEPITGEGEYTEEAISKLIAAYNAEGKQIQEKALSQSNTSSEKPAAKSKPKSSLAGLI